MDDLVTIEEARMELDENTFTPYIRFSGRLNLEIKSTNDYDPHNVLIDSLANSIGHEILRQARFLFELTKDD